jgi:hypothetical protein
MKELIAKKASNEGFKERQQYLRKVDLSIHRETIAHYLKEGWANRKKASNEGFKADNNT